MYIVALIPQMLMFRVKFNDEKLQKLRLTSFFMKHNEIVSHQKSIVMLSLVGVNCLHGNYNSVYYKISIHIAYMYHCLLDIIIDPLHKHGCFHISSVMLHISLRNKPPWRTLL